MTVLANVQISTAPAPFDFPFVNLSGADIAEFTPVSIDATAGNQLGVGTNNGIPIVAVAAIGNVVVGIAMEKIANGTSGRVRTAGIIPGICDGSVTANGVVDASNTANRTIKAHGAGKAQLGIALASGVDGDTIPVLVALADNA